jgi:hypothetical protein
VHHREGEFRPNSEIWALCASGGERVRVSALLFEAITTACDVAERTVVYCDRNPLSLPPLSSPK